MNSEAIANNQKIRVGILEDDADQGEFVKLLLEDAGYDVKHALDGPGFIRLIQSAGFDLLVLDWDVPEMSGLEVLKWARRNLQWRIPVIFLTAYEQEENIVEALQKGADDYVVKPVSPPVFMARITALARRSGLVKPAPTTIAVDQYEFNRKTGACSVAGEPLALTKREFELAYFLFDNVGKILSREYLLKQVWGMASAINTRTVDTHISRIRTKLNLKSGTGWKLSSVYHYGYRLERIAQGRDGAEDKVGTAG